MKSVLTLILLSISVIGIGQQPAIRLTVKDTVVIYHEDDWKLLLTVENVGNDTIYFRSDAIRQDILDFDDKTIEYTGPLIQPVFSDVYKSENPNLRKSVCEKLYGQYRLLPGQKRVFQLDMSDKYTGFKVGESYKAGMDILVSKEWSNSCSAVWTGNLQSNSFIIKMVRESSWD